MAVERSRPAHPNSSLFRRHRSCIAMDIVKHPLAIEHVQRFITAPGETDYLLNLSGFLIVAAVLGGGVFFFWLHSLPERMVHNKVQFDIVAVLVLLSLFTHIHAFWIAALLLAFIKFPDVTVPDVLGPLRRIADAAETMSARAEPTGEMAGAVPSAGNGGAHVGPKPSAEAPAKKG